MQEVHEKLQIINATKELVSELNRLADYMKNKYNTTTQYIVHELGEQDGKHNHIICTFAENVKLLDTSNDE